MMLKVTGDREMEKSESYVTAIGHFSSPHHSLQTRYLWPPFLSL